MHYEIKYEPINMQLKYQTLSQRPLRWSIRIFTYSDVLRMYIQAQCSIHHLLIVFAITMHACRRQDRLRFV